MKIFTEKQVYLDRWNLFHSDSVENIVGKEEIACFSVVVYFSFYSHVFQTVEENSNMIWKYQRYFLAMEFECKTQLVPPFSIIQHVFLIIRWIWQKICCPKSKISEFSVLFMCTPLKGHFMLPLSNCLCALHWKAILCYLCLIVHVHSIERPFYVTSV